ncbi:sigmaY antisigma factor component [Alkalihalobacterium chitinilyticum]|uniref:SigmaY antisigma factor component n=1 Tax=Alkalihalobacterium chitinilyticum TaxID=2980103 RepID=A0ABT5VBS5_9BACI|nr:sigmaY antisigma factor component [Alkalihalobacterium chitinilyticum]MDE5412606.1 sigmaY antisigma factor component [Alkalihalobacterium chitinilyticum]
MNDLQDLTIYHWLLIAALLIIQSTWLFIDARKRGHNRWFWGIWGLMNTPLPLIVYLVWSRIFVKKLPIRRG